MSQAKNGAEIVRWVLLNLGIIGIGMGVLFLINPLLGEGRLGWLGTGLIGLPGLARELKQWQYALVAGGYLGVFFLTQWLFLLPAKGLVIQTEKHGRPMVHAVVIAALAAALLDVGLLAALLEIPDWYAKIMYREGRIGEPRHWPFFAALAVAWGGWVWLLWMYGRRMDRPTWTRRMLKWLIGGSILELVVTAPIHAYVVNKRECYCARGSYLGLVIGGTVLLWAFGPAVILLFLREKARRQELLEQKLAASGV